MYHIHRTRTLPDLSKLKPKGEIYTTRLEIRPQNFDAGFPGVTKRDEWFAIQYEARFWAENEGIYRFRLLSDDGANLFVDEHLIVDNDGLHPPQEREGSVRLTKGVHQIRLPYFQGPRYQVALVLEIALPGREYQIFDTDRLRPPPE